MSTLDDLIKQAQLLGTIHSKGNSPDSQGAPNEKSLSNDMPDDRVESLVKQAQTLGEIEGDSGLNDALSQYEDKEDEGLLGKLGNYVSKNLVTGNHADRNNKELRDSSKFYAQQAIKGPIGLADIGHGITDLAMLPTHLAGVTTPYQEKDLPSHHIKEAINSLTGVDLDSEKPKNSTQRILGPAVEFGAGFAGGGMIGKGISKAANALIKILPKAGAAAPYIEKAIEYVKKGSDLFLGNPENSSQVAKMAVTGAALGGGIHGAIEAGVNPTVATAAGLVAPYGISKSGAIKEMAKNAGSALVNPKKYGETKAKGILKNVIGEENIPELIRDIESHEAFLKENPKQKNVEIVDGKPVSTEMDSPSHLATTSQVVDNPGLSILEETYRGQPKHPELSEGISERGVSQLEAIQEGIRALKGEKSIDAQATHNYVSAKEAERIASEEARELADIGKREAATKGALDQFSDLHSGDSTAAEQTGKTIKEEMASELKKREGVRRLEVGEEYRQLRDIEGEYEATPALSFIEEELKHVARGSRAEKALLDARKSILPEEVTTPTETIKGKNGDYIISTENGRQKIVPKPAEGKTKGLKASKLEGAMQELGEKASEAFVAGRKNSSRIYNRVKELVGESLKDVPGVKEAREKYAKASVPVNEIDLHPTFSKILKNTKFNAHSVIPESEIPHAIVSASEGSHSVSTDFMKIFGKNKKVMGDFKKYINDKVLKSILDKNGQIVPEKVKAFRDKNAGAFKIYKHLDTKLDNAKNQGKFVNELSKEKYKETTQSYKDLVKTITGDYSDKLVGRLLGSENSVEKITKLKDMLKTDKTGEALEGLRRSTIDHVASHSETQGKFIQFYKSKFKQLNELFGAGSPEMKFLSEVNKVYRDKRKVAWHAKTENSATGARIEINKLLKGDQEPKTLLEHISKSAAAPASSAVVGYVLGGPAGSVLGLLGGGAKNWWSSVVKNSLQKTIQEVMIDPHSMKILLQDISKKEGVKEVNKLVGEWRKNQRSGYVLGRREKEED